MEAKNIFKQPRAKAKQTCTMSNLVGLNRNTELCIDLKTILRSDRKAKTHKDYPGVLTRDGREHSHDYAFIVYRELLGALKGLVGRM